MWLSMVFQYPDSFGLVFFLFFCSVILLIVLQVYIILFILDSPREVQFGVGGWEEKQVKGA